MWDSRMLLWQVKSMNGRLYQHSTGGTFTVGSVSAFSQESQQHRYTESSWWALLSHGSNCSFLYQHSRLPIYNAAPWDYEKPCSSKVCRDSHVCNVPLCSLARLQLLSNHTFWEVQRKRETQTFNVLLKPGYLQRECWISHFHMKLSSSLIERYRGSQYGVDE